jgi:hypothetical protein
MQNFIKSTVGTIELNKVAEDHSFFVKTAAMRRVFIGK